MDSEKYIKPEKKAGDAIHKIVKVGLSAGVPVVGGVASELLEAIIAPPLSKRRDEWIESIAEGLRELEEKIDGFKIEDLSKNESFITTILNSTQSVLRNHQKEKLEALRNVVLNSAISVEKDVHSIFLGFVDVLTPLHMKLLKIFGDPPTKGEYEKLPQELKKLYYSHPFFHFSDLPADLAKAFDEFRGKENIVTIILKDLSSKDLVALQVLDTSHDMAGDFGIPSAKITEFGKQFLNFIQSPLKDKNKGGG